MPKKVVTDNQVLIKSLQDQASSLDENWKRALADYQNLLRRVDHDKKEFTKIANANLIARLVPALDIMELASTHSQDIGVQMAAKEFHQALSEEGLQTIEPKIGDPFDHLSHECTETIDLSADNLDNTVAELILKGYKLSDYVLRPARVKVYKKLAVSHPEPEAKDPEK